MFSKDLLQQQQSEDAVIRWISLPDSAPTDSDSRTMDPDIQNLYTQRATLELKDGVLYCQLSRATGEVEFCEVVVLRALRTNFIDAVHCEWASWSAKDAAEVKKVAYCRG